VKITVGPPGSTGERPDRAHPPRAHGDRPVDAWRRASISNLRSMFLWPLAIALVAAPCLALLGVRHGYALVSFTLAVFVIAAIGQEFWRGSPRGGGSTGRGPGPPCGA